MKLHLVTMLAIALLGSAVSADVYTAQYRGDAYSCDLDGSNPAQVADGNDSERFSAIDASGDYVYVGLGRTSAGNGIVRYDLDGSNPTVLSSNLVKTDSIVATDSSLYYLSGMDIHVADLAGTNDSVLYTLGSNLTAFWGDSMSVTNSKLHWIVDDRRFQMCDLDGSNATQVFQVGSGDGLTSACIDSDYIYYSVEATNTIYRRDLDGSNETALLTDTAKAAGVTSLQIVDGLLYWAASDLNLYSMDASGGTASELYNFNTVFSTSLSREIFVDVEVIPEPATISLLALSGLALLRRRNR